VEPVKPLLNAPDRPPNLAGLLAAVSGQEHLGHEYHNEADYWAGRVDPGLAADDARTIAWPLWDMAGSPWLPEPVEQWARTWAGSFEEFAGGPATT
jgi:hypothetical protein